MISLLLHALALGQDVPAELSTAPALNAQLYRHSIDARHSLWTDDAGSRREGWFFGGRLGANYVNNPFVVHWEDADGVHTSRIVSDALTSNLIGHVGYDRVRLGANVPLYLFSASQIADGGAGLGDVELDLRVNLFNRFEHSAGFAVTGRSQFPTATVDGSLGGQNTGWELGVAGDKSFGPVLLAANVGTRGVPRTDVTNVVWDDQFYFRSAVGVDTSENNGVSLDVAGSLTYAMLGADKADSFGAGVPIEAVLGGWQRAVADLFVQAGVGTGLTNGIGAPAARIVLALDYRPGSEEPVVDPDGDGLVGRFDDCPEVPEDKDGHRDADGCPDDPGTLLVEVVGMDGVRIPCDVVLDIQGKETPYVEPTLSDTAVDVTASASLAGYLPASATVRIDPDVGETRVKLVLEPLQGKLTVVVIDEKGAKIDSALVYVGDEAGREAAIATGMPVDAGAHKVRAEAKGYASATQTATVVGGEGAELIFELAAAEASLVAGKIDLRDVVHFDTSRATIQSRSFDLLAEVADILARHPEILVLSIEGHTDSRGNDAYNLDLSQRRAAAVRAHLIELGVAASRVSSEGFGETKPLDSGQNAQAWEKNRRVEFFVAKWGDDL
jgi:outer membrane protein OmpA-like peptidoglycan-associated protein